jgi:general secretion pathway protein D
MQIPVTCLCVRAGRFPRLGYLAAGLLSLAVSAAALADDPATPAAEPAAAEAPADDADTTEENGSETGVAPDADAQDTNSDNDAAADAAEANPEANDDADADSEADPDAEPEIENISVSFRDAEMPQIAQFLMNQLGKPVIVDDSIKQVRITIMSPDEMPPAEALELIGNALRQKGVIIVDSRRQTELASIERVRQVDRPVVGIDESVADLPDQSIIVDKVFAIEHYDVLRLKDSVLPMLPEYAFLVADPNVKRLIVTAAAGDLLYVENLIRRLDVPRANQTEQRIIPVVNGDASEIVAMVRTIIAGTLGIESMDVFTSPPPTGNNRSRGRGSRNNEPASNTIFVQPNEAPIMLQADLSRNWIIAAASPQVMEQIERWVKELDQPKERNEPYELFDITHADVEELADQIGEAINAMPDADIRNSVRVIPFTKSRQLLIYGSQRGRALVRSLLQQLDIESSQHQVIKEIVLQHDEAESVKQKVEELFSQTGSSGGRFYFFGRSRPSAPELTVTADSQRNTITIMTDPPRLARIEKIIREQWDTPLDLDEVKPRVYSLKYSDPVRVKTLFEDMFTRSQTRTTGSWWRSTVEQTTPVGRLFGQFSFVAMQDSNKLIVSTKNAANYVVIDELIEEIDKPQEAGLPMVIELKHANAEEVAEQLNAMFSEPGTPAAVMRSRRGLSQQIRNEGVMSTNAGGNNNRNNNTGNNNNPGGGGNPTNPQQMTFWWSQSRPNVNEQPTSNLIGKPRFVPVNRRNALMVLVPRAQAEPLRDLIADLDKPGSQVVIHAVIAEIQHNDETTLGLRLASDPSIFSDSRLADQAIGGGVNADLTSSFANGDGILDVGVNVNLLLQLLIKKLDLKILNEPRVYTADNQEAHFFDGQDVPTVLSDLTRGDSDGNVTRTFEYRSVGTRLHVRPHITQEGEVDLEVNLELSRIVNGSSVFGNFIFDRRETTTHVTVQDGQTIVISGIVQQEDFEEIRKFPLLGDIPLIGLLFRSTDAAVRNREIIAFVTPRVVTNAGDRARQMSEENQEWLERIRGAVEQPDDDRGIYRSPQREELDEAEIED